MRFADILLRLGSGDGEHISSDEIVEAYKASFPADRRTRLGPQVAESLEPRPGLPEVDWKNGAFRPGNVDEVVKVVMFARSRNRRVRVAGSQHSTAPAVYSTDLRDLRVVLDGTLRDVTFLSKDEKGATVLVGGGRYLGVNPSDGSSTPETSLNALLDAHGYALPSLGGISHQTVAGFLQTSSAGGSLAYGFADAVQAIELVDGTGRIRWLQVGSAAFNAAAVAMGLFGVVTHVVLAVGPRYFVEGSEDNHPEDDSFLHKESNGRYRLQDAIGSTPYLHLNWFPQPGVERVTHWTGSRTDTGPPVCPYTSELKELWMNILAAFVLLLTSGVLAIDPHGPIAARIVASLLGQFVPLKKCQKFRDSWYTVLPSDDQVQVDTLIKVIFTEIWLPLDQLTAAVDRLKVIVADQAVAGNFAIELYGARQSPFWLSPSFDRDVVRVDVFWWAYSFGDPREHFTHFWNALLELDGARLHWGKHLPDVGRQYGDVVFDVDLLERRYLKLRDWLALRREMDPAGVFVTDYWRQVFAL
jgi:D-arabinono-1,4-lactone oxidase